MENVVSEKYLGDTIMANGSNKLNIKKRMDKGVGGVSQIMTILENTCYGPYHFQVAAVLRESLLVNSILTNSEAWYGLTKSDIELLESVDELLLRRVLEVPSTCPKEMLYLEMGCLPIKFIISSRRLAFLHYILNENETSVISRVFKAQCSQPLQDDWCKSVTADIENFQLNLDFSEIKEMSENSFKLRVKSAVTCKAMEELTKLKNKHSKVMNIVHRKLEMQKYLKPNSLTNREAKFAFHSRTRMLKVRKNYGGSYSKHFCPICKDENEEDSQQHLLFCERLVDNNTLAEEVPVYNDLFSEHLDKQIRIVRILVTNFKARTNILKSEK